LRITDRGPAAQEGAGPPGAVQAAAGQDAPDERGGDHQPQLRSARTARWWARASASAPAWSQEMVAVMSAISSAAPRLMTTSSTSLTWPALDTPISSGNVTTACLPAQRTG
jgi:hypothetical protein